MNFLKVKKYYHLIKVIEQAKFTYSILGKAFGKQVKTIGDEGIRQVEALKLEENKQDIKSIDGIFPKEMRSNEIKNEIDKIKK